MKHEVVPLDQIRVGFRFRKDSGDMEALKQNIREMGLLQPIGIDSYYNLIFGQRRYDACSDLGWETIPCVILNLESVLAGEYAENEFRKNFTPSERTAIGKAVEEELGAKNRRGGDRRSSAAIAAHGFVKGLNWDTGRTVDLAAQRAGFRSAETYERAKTVTDKGSPELIEAMDKGDVSISAAAAIASQPKDEQKRIVRMPKDEQRTVIRQIQKTRADKERDENRARDLRLFAGLLHAVEFIATFQPTAKETWEGLERVCAYDFAKHLKPAIYCLIRIDKEHPNAERKPEILTKKAQ